MKPSRELWEYYGVTYPPHGIGYHHWVLDPATRTPNSPGYDHVFWKVADYRVAATNGVGQ